MNTEGSWISKIAVLILDAVVLFLIITGKSIASWMSTYFPKCIFYENGFICPSCGATRCINSILSFDFVNAFNFNPIIFVFAFYIAGLIMLVNLNYLFNIKMGKVMKLYISHWVFIGFSVAFAFIGVFRNFV